MANILNKGFNDVSTGVIDRYLEGQDVSHLSDEVIDKLQADGHLVEGDYDGDGEADAEKPKAKAKVKAKAKANPKVKPVTIPSPQGNDEPGIL